MVATRNPVQQPSSLPFSREQECNCFKVGFDSWNKEARFSRRAVRMGGGGRGGGGWGGSHVS